MQPFYHLREGPAQVGDDRIISVYTEMYDAFLEQLGLVPEDRRCEVGYEELEREPEEAVGSISKALGLMGFEDVRPRLKSYLGSIGGYRKNRLDDLPGPLRCRIAEEWGRRFDEWGYRR